MKRFSIEQGDVLLSIQLVLTREEEAGKRLLAKPAAAGAASRRLQLAAAPPRPAHLRPAPSPSVPQRQPAIPPVPSIPSRRSGTAPHPAGPPLMVDPLTGVGTLHALRRDWMLQQAMPGSGAEPSAVVALDVAGLDGIREAMGAQAGNQVLKSLVDVAPFTLRTQDRVYRSGRNQLTLLLPATDAAGAESARKGLEDALQRTLAGRGYPEIRLSARKVDAVALAS